MVSHWKILAGGLVTACTLLPVLATTTLPRRQPRAPSLRTPAAWVTAWVHDSLVLPVLSSESALAGANSQVLAFDAVPLHPRDGPGGQSAAPSADYLARLLAAHAVILRQATARLTLTALPPLDYAQTLLAARLLEDLVLFSDQGASALQDSATVVAHTTAPDMALSMAYWFSVRRAVTLLRRAEGWLERLDDATAAHAHLPGFAPGELSIDEQLDL